MTTARTLWVKALRPPAEFSTFGGWCSGTKFPEGVSNSRLPQVWHPVVAPIRLISRRSAGVKLRSGPRAGIDSSAKEPGPIPTCASSSSRASASWASDSVARILPSVVSVKLGVGCQFGSKLMDLSYCFLPTGNCQRETGGLPRCFRLKTFNLSRSSSSGGMILCDLCQPATAARHHCPSIARPLDCQRERAAGLG